MTIELVLRRSKYGTEETHYSNIANFKIVDDFLHLTNAVKEEVYLIPVINVIHLQALTEKESNKKQFETTKIGKYIEKKDTYLDGKPVFHYYFFGDNGVECFFSVDESVLVLGEKEAEEKLDEIYKETMGKTAIRNKREV